MSAMQRPMLSPPAQNADWIKRRHELFRLADRDAAALIRTLGRAAYGEARRRARESRRQPIADRSHPDGHWERVRIMVAQRLGRLR
jgi:hypothetical protein